MLQLLLCCKTFRYFTGVQLCSLLLVFVRKTSKSNWAQLKISPSTQNRKLVIFLQCLKKKCYNYCCVAKHSDILQGSSYVRCFLFLLGKLANQIGPSLKSHHPTSKLFSKVFTAKCILLLMKGVRVRKLDTLFV